MELQNNLHTEDGWQIIERAFDPEQLVTTGSNFMLGNGYLGYRGTFAEWEAEQYVACIVTDTWDTAADSTWRELCNVPNGLFTRALVAGEPLSAFTGETRDYERRLDLRTGLSTRCATWSGAAGKSITLKVEKFASYDEVQLVVMRYHLEAHADTELILLTGIDGQVWSLNGEHFRVYEPAVEGALLRLSTRTVEFDTQIEVVEGLRLTGKAPVRTTIRQEERRILRELRFRMRAGDAITLEKVVAITHSNQCDAPRAEALALVTRGVAAGFEALYAAHRAHWDAIWAVSDIEIGGNLEAQVLARFNLYHNIIATPTHDKLPIGARGLSCQVYQGAAFWDQEIFNLPMFLYTQPEVARQILEYRHVTLPGARKKARDLGYYGAFYAWTSGKTGEELFPDYFFTDVLTGRPIHNHFNSWQIHISPDIVYAVWQYYEATGDWDFIVQAGAEIAFEVAQFLVSHVYFKKDKNRYEFIRLLGPDEYHENVDNNAYTNYMAHYALERALLIFERLAEENPAALEVLLARLGLDASVTAAWQDIVELLYLPQPDPETGVIEQCDGFFKLEDVTPAELRKRLIHPEEYWGWPNGIAVEAQVLKQADVLQLLAQIPRWPVEILRANYDYYEPRTEHGSSLSPSVHALIATKAGLYDEAYRYFMEAATIDLYNMSKKVMSGGSFLGGIHTAAAGGVWIMIVQGMAGFAVTETGVRFAPALPAQWEALRFSVRVRGHALAVEITAEALTVRAGEENPGALPVTVGEETVAVAAGETATFRSDGGVK